jgi:hypothetical protein
VVEEAAGEKTGGGEAEGEEAGGGEAEGEEAGGGKKEGGEGEGGERPGLRKPVTIEAVGGLAWAMAAKGLPCLSTSLQLAGSTIRLCCFKKSTPKIGKSTAASRKGHENNRP